jgi:hypothetical protein
MVLLACCFGSQKLTAGMLPGEIVEKQAMHVNNLRTNAGSKCLD